MAEKRLRAEAYAVLVSGTDWKFMREPDGCRSNYWLCAVRAPNRAARDTFLQAAHADSIFCRPAWEPLHTLPIYAHCQHDALTFTLHAADGIINLPSGVLR